MRSGSFFMCDPAAGFGRGDHASSLHDVATTRGSFMPDIDPRGHRLMIHGMVDRPLTFTMEDLKRLPSVTRLHFIECAGNEAESEDRSGIARDDQLRRMDWRARAQLKGALKSAMTSP
jgi:DMSO/TMAO reductase YedYZ molybdopterin-dependent catalytic subunit